MQIENIISKALPLVRYKELQSELSLVDYYLGLEGFLMIQFSHHVTVRQLDMFVVVRRRLIVFGLLVGSHFARILLRVCNCSVHKISEIS